MGDRGSVKYSPVTPPLNKGHSPGMGYSSSDSLDHQSTQTPNHYDSASLASTPKLSSISGTKTETSSVDDGYVRSSEADQSEGVSVSNASDMETEWVEQDEPGIYITIRALPDGNRELSVRFSRHKFGETHARLWWEQNRARIQKQYLRFNRATRQRISVRAPLASFPKWATQAIPSGV